MQRKLWYLAKRDQKSVALSLKQVRNPSVIIKLLDSLLFESSFYRPMTKEQFFEDRPWLQPNEQVYEDYLAERIKSANDILNERKSELYQYSLKERVQKLYEKKTN